MEDCIFCKIGSHDAEAKVEFENDFVIAFPSIDKAAETHLLIVPKTHVSNFMELNNSETLFEMTKAAQQLIKEKNIESGYKLIFNGGKYQAIPHLHWHLLAGKLEDDKT